MHSQQINDLVKELKEKNDLIVFIAKESSKKNVNLTIRTYKDKNLNEPVGGYCEICTNKGTLRFYTSKENNEINILVPYGKFKLRAGSFTGQWCSRGKLVDQIEFGKKYEMNIYQNPRYP